MPLWPGASPWSPEARDGGLTRACYGGTYSAANLGAPAPQRHDLGWHLRLAGRYAEVTYTPTAPRERKGGGVRGSCRLWTRQSRVRLLKELAGIDWESWGPLLFVTLTYPAHFPTDGQTVKTHLARLRRRWQRRFGAPHGAWKLEFQARGAPHVHLVLERPKAWKGLGKWLSKAWAAAADTKDESERAKHERAGTRIDQWKGDPAHYLTKYTHGHAKEYQHDVPEEMVNVGRWWGFWTCNRRERHRGFTSLELDPEVAMVARRALKHHLNAQRKRNGQQKQRRRLQSDSSIWGVFGTPTGISGGELLTLVTRYAAGDFDPGRDPLAAKVAKALEAEREERRNDPDRQPDRPPPQAVRDHRRGSPGA